MIADLFDAFFFDLDGVVYVGKRTTPGAAETITALRERGKAVRFLTNNPMDRARIAWRLSSYGVDADVGEVITAGWAAAHYLRERGTKRAWVLGEIGLHDEITQAGILEVEGEGCEAVVVGWDDAVTLGVVRYAALAIKKGADFVATNVDSTYPTLEGDMAGVGAVVAALATGSGREPVVVGKPFPPMFQAAIDSVGVPRSRIVMIGDTPESDILGAHRAGIASLLMGDVAAPPEADPGHPNGRVQTLRDLLTPGGAARVFLHPKG